MHCTIICITDWIGLVVIRTFPFSSFAPSISSLPTPPFPLRITLQACLLLCVTTVTVLHWPYNYYQTCILSNQSKNKASKDRPAVKLIIHYQIFVPTIGLQSYHSFFPFKVIHRGIFETLVSIYCYQSLFSTWYSFLLLV